MTPVVPDLAWPPRLADGTELLGEFKNSGVTEPPSLVRRADGQVIQLSRLVYLVASLLDGSRGPDVIAAKASAELGRTLSADRSATSSPPSSRRSGSSRAPACPPPCRRHGPLLALRARATLLPATAADAAGAFLRPLFSWPVIAAVIGGVVALDYWILSVRGLVAALRSYSMTRWTCCW